VLLLEYYSLQTLSLSFVGLQTLSLSFVGLQTLSLSSPRHYYANSPRIWQAAGHLLLFLFVGSYSTPHNWFQYPHQHGATGASAPKAAVGIAKALGPPAGANKYTYAERRTAAQTLRSYARSNVATPC